MSDSKKMLYLLSFAVAALGLIIIIGGLFTTGTLHEALVGIGSAIFATGPITAVVWWATDQIYNRELNAALREQLSENIAASISKLRDDITETAGGIKNSMLEANLILRDYKNLGVLRIFSTRADAFNQFSGYINDEIKRAKNDEKALLWFVCTDFKGFLNIATNEFNPEELIRSAAAVQDKLRLRILIADPEYSVARSGGGESEDRIRENARTLLDKLHEYGVDSRAIRQYAFKPTVFAIATSRHMLLNPYPNEDQGHRCMTIVVNKTAPKGASQNTRDVYSQYMEGHFGKTWDAVTTRKVGDPPPLISRISLSKDNIDAVTALRKEVSEQRPSSADLLEFSGSTVKPLLVELAEAGVNVRLLLKDPRSVSSSQRQKIMSTYGELEAQVFSSNPDSFQVRFYDVPATLCGRRLDDRLLSVSWYTPVISAKGVVSDWPIIGDRNPAITCDPRTSEGEELCRMFKSVFTGLWANSVSLDFTAM